MKIGRRSFLFAASRHRSYHENNFLQAAVFFEYKRDMSMKPPFSKPHNKDLCKYGNFYMTNQLNKKRTMGKIYIRLPFDSLANMTRARGLF